MLMSSSKLRKCCRLGRFALVPSILFFIIFLTVVVNISFVLDSFSPRRSIVPSSPQHVLIAETNKLVKIEKSGSIDIEVYSSKESVYVSVDGIKVMEENNTKESRRGIHVAVLHQATGSLMAKEVFDTCYYKEESDYLSRFLEKITSGRILCIAVKDEASTSLQKNVRDLLTELGSTHIADLKWRETWAFIGAKRARKYAEKRGHVGKAGKWAKPVTARATLALATEEESRCAWRDSEETKRRRAFCERYEGYGSVCRCINPSPIDITASVINENQVSDIPVVVIASNRPRYLYRALRSILSADGANKELFTVFIDGFFDEPVAVAKLFDIRAVQHVPISSKNARISQHYKRTLTETFDMYPKAKYMIIFEEDLEVAVDIFSYFSQLLPLMEVDKSLYCISAWNDQGYNYSCKDPEMLYRIETMPGLGWLLQRRLFKEELEARWPAPNHFWDWDMWMRIDANRKGRECIIPDVSRTFHFGAKGLHVGVNFQVSYFGKRRLNKKHNVKFDVALMKKDNYERKIESLMSNATVLDHSKDPCKNKMNFMPNTTGKLYVLYIEMNNRTDWTTWNNIAACLRIWDLDVRGVHNSMWRLWWKENHFMIVGTPASPYAKFKPSDVKPVFLPKKST